MISNSNYIPITCIKLFPIISVQIIIIVHMVELCIVIFQFLYACKIWKKNTKQNIEYSLFKLTITFLYMLMTKISYQDIKQVSDRQMCLL